YTTGWKSTVPRTSPAPTTSSTTNRKKPVPHVPDAFAPGGKLSFSLEVERIQRELATSARNALVAAAAHDLRSPLNGIQGWAHVLESRVGSESPLVRRALDGIRNGVGQQAQLIGDLTDMLHILNGDMTLHPEVVSLHSVIENVLNGLRDVASARKVVFSFNGADATVWADAGRLTQAVDRVLSHIVRISLEGEQIEVEARAEPHAIVLVVGGRQELVHSTQGQPPRAIKL